LGLAVKLNQETAEAIVQDAYACWNVGDVEGMLKHYVDDMIYVSNVGGPGGEKRVLNGKRDFGAFYRDVMANFESVASIDNFRFSDGVASARVTSVTRHRLSDLQIEGSHRQLTHFDGFKICKLEVFQDAAKISAFWKLLLAESPDALRWLTFEVG
jgi:ketosteroid isomerase-like protein